MTDLLTKAKALEARHRKPPETPRAWAESIIKGAHTIDHAPEHFRAIVSDHLETHRMLVDAKAKAILALANGKERLAAFTKLAKEMQGPVKARVHELKEQA
jgi:IS30 family transposase